MPVTKYFCTKGYTHKMGRVEITMAPYPTFLAYTVLHSFVLVQRLFCKLQGYPESFFHLTVGIIDQLCHVFFSE